MGPVIKHLVTGRIGNIEFCFPWGQLFSALWSPCLRFLSIWQKFSNFFHPQLPSPRVVKIYCQCNALEFYLTCSYTERPLCGMRCSLRPNLAHPWRILSAYSGESFLMTVLFFKILFNLSLSLGYHFHVVGLLKWENFFREVPWGNWEAAPGQQGDGSAENEVSNAVLFMLQTYKCPMFQNCYDVVHAGSLTLFRNMIN